MFSISWIKYVPLLLSLLGVGYLYVYKNKLESNLSEVRMELQSTKAELSKEQFLTETLSLQLEDTRLKVLEQRQRLSNLQGATKVAREQNNASNSILDSFKGKERIGIEGSTNETPEDIERNANDYINKLMLKYECETGNSGSC